jgi:hypothetical protein
MSAISKQALVVDNSQSFPNNNAGAITPTALRNFNTNMIDSNVNQTEYNTNSGSWNVSISNLNTFTASQQPTFNALNSFTASQLTINTGVNSFTQSANSSISQINQATASLQNFTSSINDIIVNGNVIGQSTRFFFNGYVSSSIIQNVNGPIASITILADQTFTPTASFNAYTSSTNTFTASAKTSISAINSFTASQNSFNASATASLIELLNFSSSLDVTYATDAQLAYSASVLQANIDTKVFTSSFNDYTQSVNNTIATLATTASFNNLSSSVSGTISALSTSIQITDNAQTDRINTLSSFTGSYATTGSNLFNGNETITGSITITGSAYGNVFSASIVSSTASIDLSVANFFTLSLPNGVNTRINITNPKPGTTAILEITNNGIATASFNADVKQQRFNNYEPTSGSAVDLLSIISLSTSSIYVANSLNFV